MRCVALSGLAAIIVTGVALIFVGPLFISAEDVRNKLFAEIESDRLRLIVNGPLHISAFPSLKLMAGEVSAVQSLHLTGPLVRMAGDDDRSFALDPARPRFQVQRPLGATLSNSGGIAGLVKNKAAASSNRA